jgi:hypothetical protein
VRAPDALLAGGRPRARSKERPQMSKTKAPKGAAEDRRAFLAAAGTFAVVTPPAMTMLLSTSLASPAIAASGRGGPVYDPGSPGHGPPDPPPHGHQ